MYPPIPYDKILLDGDIHGGDGCLLAFGRRGVVVESLVKSVLMAADRNSWAGLQCTPRSQWQVPLPYISFSWS